MLKLEGVQRSQVKELRREARNLADHYPDIHGAIFVGRKLAPIEEATGQLLRSRTGERPAYWLVDLCRFTTVPGSTLPSLMSHESERYGANHDHISVVFYGDPRGYRRFVALAESMHQMGVEYSTLGPFAGYPEWFAAGALLGYLLTTADHHNDGMAIKTVEGTTEHPDWLGPITYYAIRPSVTRATKFLLAGTLARSLEPARIIEVPALPAPPVRRRGDVKLEVEGLYLALVMRFIRGQRKEMPTQAEIARVVGCDEGTVSRVIRLLRSKVDGMLAASRARC